MTLLVIIGSNSYCITIRWTSEFWPLEEEFHFPFNIGNWFLKTPNYYLQKRVQKLIPIWTWFSHYPFLVQLVIWGVRKWLPLILSSNCWFIFLLILGRPEVRGLPCFLLGQSMGGAVALKANLKAPQDWDGVVLVAPMCKVSQCSSWRWIFEVPAFFALVFLVLELIFPRLELLIENFTWNLFFFWLVSRQLEIKLTPRGHKARLRMPHHKYSPKDSSHSLKANRLKNSLSRTFKCWIFFKSMLLFLPLEGYSFLHGSMTCLPERS